MKKFIFGFIFTLCVLCGWCSCNHKQQPVAEESACADSCVVDSIITDTLAADTVVVTDTVETAE